MRTIGNKNTVLLGLGFQLLQLTWYGFGSEPWWALDPYPCGSVLLFWFCWVLTALVVFRMMWAAGTIAAMSSITFPAVSALVSHCASADQQGEYELTADPLLGLLSCLINCVHRCGPGHDHRYQRVVQRSGSCSVWLHLLPVQCGAERCTASNRTIAESRGLQTHTHTHRQ